MLFDTGSDETQLWPRFAREFPGAVEGGKKESKTVTGFTGSTEIESIVLSSIQFRLGGANTTIRPVRLLMRKTLKSSERLHGWLGFDALERGATVDFRAMTIRVESGNSAHGRQ